MTSQKPAYYWSWLIILSDGREVCGGVGLGGDDIRREVQAEFPSS